MEIWSIWADLAWIDKNKHSVNIISTKSAYLKMELFLKKIYIKNCEQKDKKTCGKHKLAIVSSVSILWVSVTKEIPVPGWEKVNTWNWGKICQTVQDGVQIMKSHGSTERLLLHVQYLNSRCSPSSNTIKLNFMDS